MARIGLCMIVKNEAGIIRRCLESVLPLLDYALVVDTGSTDGTQQAIRDFLDEKALPGEVVEEPWRDFAYNRSFALRKLRERKDIDYALVVDADDVLVYGEGFDAGRFKADLYCDVYDIPIRQDTILFQRPQLFSNRLPFHYKAVLHEYLECGQIGSRGRVAGFHILPVQDGFRSRNPQKFSDDAALLESALLAETDPFLIARYTFYLAQSYKDCGKLPKALDAYLRRSQLGFWDQEVYVSLHRAAQIKEVLGDAEAELIQAYLAAHEVCPVRAEALHGAVRCCRLKGKYQQGYILSRHGLGLACPPDSLFAEPWIYDYGLLDEFSIAAYWAGHYQESFEACLKLLREGKAPADQQARIRRNAEFSIEKLQQPELRRLLG